MRTLVLALWLAGCASDTPPEGPAAAEESAAAPQREQRRFEIEYRVQLEAPARGLGASRSLPQR